MRFINIAKAENQMCNCRAVLSGLHSLFPFICFFKVSKTFSWNHKSNSFIQNRHVCLEEGNDCILCCSIIGQGHWRKIISPKSFYLWFWMKKKTVCKQTLLLNNRSQETLCLSHNFKYCKVIRWIGNLPCQENLLIFNTFCGCL